MVRASLLACLLAAGTAGCHRVTLADDVDLELDFHPLTGPSDALHSPYVQGATLRIWARSTNDDERMEGWTLETSDPGVLTITRTYHDGQLSADCHAAGEGQTVLRVRDAMGALLADATVRVRAADRAVLLAHGPLLIGRSAAEAEVREARVLQGGTATFLVRWYGGGELLNGNGVLAVESGPGVTPQAERTYLFEDRDWLQVTATELGGPIDVTLRADGRAVGTFPVTVVAPSALARMEIVGEDESRADKGDSLVALAQAWDAEGQPLWGVTYRWDVDGTTQQGMGDLYRYTYDPKGPHMLAARVGDLQAQALIHGTGHVSSTNLIGCSVAGHGGRSTGTGAALLGVLVGGLALRRRRR